jgi:hypothetical protein
MLASVVALYNEAGLPLVPLLYWKEDGSSVVEEKAIGIGGYSNAVGHGG